MKDDIKTENQTFSENMSIDTIAFGRNNNNNSCHAERERSRRIFPR
jgi:hypothetical protein